MIPASSQAFLVTNLVSGTKYDLCVLAAWDDTATTLTATNVVGCAQFFTRDDYTQCQSLHSQFLGGTMILVVGGIIVATLLVFIVILMVRYKATDHEGGGIGGSGKLTSVSDTHSQNNGGRLGQNGVPLPLPKPKAKVTLQDEVVEFKCGSLQSTSSSSSSGGSVVGEGSYSPNSTLAIMWRQAAPSKPRANLDHLLGAFNSLELRGPQGRGDLGEPSSSSSTPVAGGDRPHTDREPLLGRTMDSRLSRLLMLSHDSKPKRSQSFDMGDCMDTDQQTDQAMASSTSTATTPVCSYPRRISNIWTKRSLSVNGMLLQCDEEGDMGGGKGTFDSQEWVMESTV